MTAACPGCVAGGPAVEAVASGLPTHEIIVPSMHCAGCMRTVENALNARPDIANARVNLTRKRVSITASPEADPAPWIETLAGVGFEAHEVSENVSLANESGLILRLGIAGFAMMNVMLLSVAVWSGATDVTRDFFHWIAAAIALPAAIYCAEPFFANARAALSKGRLNMDVPISLAIVLACGLSLFETVRGGEHAYFDAALSLTFFLLSGRVLEARMRGAARSAAADLAALEPARVIVLGIDGARESISVSDLSVGQHLWLTAGARVPVDGILSEGETRIDRSGLTGESDPVACYAGANVMAGDIIIDGPVIIEARTVGEATTLRRMIQLASVAEGARSKYTSLADRAAKIYAPLVHGLALLAFLGWVAYDGDVHHALTIAIATLIITCPCALGLAVPAVATVATGRLFRAGILVKSETALERLAEIDTVVFDKTGTLTRSILDIPETLSTAHRAVLKSLAEASDHPLSQSLLEPLDAVAATALDGLREVPGKGVSAMWGDNPVKLGAASWIGSGEGTVLAIGSEVFQLPRREVLLHGARETVVALTKAGFPVHLFTGDMPAHAKRIGEDLGLVNVHAEMLPDDKQALVARMQESGQRVLMVGDGLNDTLALTQAWASIAPGTALQASQNAADVVLLQGHLEGIVQALHVSRSARRRILENFSVAACYNAIAIPFCLAGFATPLMAAIAMSTSSLVVTLNAMRTRLKK